MAQIEILREREIPAGWTFEAQIIDEQGLLSAIELTLSWADYNLWSSDGSDAPAAVAKAVVMLLLERLRPDQLRPVFDAASIRRQFPDADTVIPTMIDP